MYIPFSPRRLKDTKKTKILGRTLYLCDFVIILGFMLAGCRSNTKTPLSVFIAGSLMVPFDELEQAYEELHPDVDLRVEAHGSIQCVRHVTEIHDPIDVVIPADYALIPMLMYSNTVSESGEPYAGLVYQVCQ